MSDQKNVQPQPPPAATSATTTAAAPAGTRSELGAAALTFVLWLLLVDAAVETFLSGAPVRWWVAGVVAAYLGLTAVVWRASGDRFGWSRRATASLFVLLGLLAGTAWLRDGLTNGAAMLRQPTSVVLSAVSALAVAAAGLVLVRGRFLPWWGRTALGLVALYGVTAFVVGMIEGLPYPNLFQGESLWRRLPYWLQGAFIGTLVAVPLAMVSAIVDAFRSLRAADGRRWGLQQSLALGLATLIAMSGFTMHGGARTPSGVSSRSQRVGAGVVPASVRTPETRERSIQDFYSTVELADQKAQASETDLGQLAERLRGDPTAIRNFVSGAIRYEHYNGVLRGAAGALIAGAGNSCDQSLLVRELLSRGGRRSSLMVGVADAKTNASLLSRAVTRDRRRPALSRWTDGALVRTVGVTLRRLAAETPALATAVGSTSGAGPVIRAHCWARIEDGSEPVDVDPLFDVTPLAKTDGKRFESIPESLRHRFQIRILLKPRSTSSERLLVAATFSPDEMMFDSIGVAIVPKRSSVLDALLAGQDPWAVLDTADEFVPVITIGERRIADRGFNLQGEEILPNASPLQGVDRLGDRIGGMLGGGRRSSQDRSEASATPSARPPDPPTIVLEYRLQFPDGTADEGRRLLVDGAAVKGRRVGELALQMLTDSQVLLPTFEIPDSHVVRRLARFYRQQRPLFEALAREDEAEIRRKLPAAGTFPFELLALARAQDSVAASLSEGLPARLFRGRPGVLMCRNALSVDERGEVERVSLIDIIDTGFDVVPAVGRGKILRSMMGIASSMLEMRLLGSARPISALTLLEDARHAGIAIVSLSGPTDPSLTRLRVNARLRDTIVGELKRGQVLVTPVQPLPASSLASGRFGWWRIDPATGETLAVLENGEGGAVQTERMTLKATVVIGVVAGALSAFLICYFRGGGSATTCLPAAACGALVGGLAGALGFWIAGLLEGFITVTTAGVLGAGGGVILDQATEFCEPPRCDRSVDNDCDGEANDSDANDNCPRCDPNNPPPDNPNDTESDDRDGDERRDSDDAFPSNPLEQDDMDGDGDGDHSDDDIDGDGYKNDTCGFPVFGGCDQFPRDPTAHRDTDGDSVDDTRDEKPEDPNVTGDADHDGIDDRVDLDPTRPGPWIAPDGDGGDVTPQPSWERPEWARP